MVSRAPGSPLPVNGLLSLTLPGLNQYGFYPLCTTYNIGGQGPPMLVLTRGLAIKAHSSALPADGHKRVAHPGSRCKIDIEHQYMTA